MSTKSALKNKYTTLVLCGGGCKCISFCGVIKFIEECKLFNIKEIVGSSAGAIIGLLYVVGYTSDELIKAVFNINNENVYGTSSIFSVFNIPFSVYNLYSKNGLYDINNLRKLIELLLSAKKIKPNITFEKLYTRTKKKLVLTATSITNRSIKVFSCDATPKYSVVDCLCASACVPFIFSPIQIKNKYYIDGGVLDNFPINYVSNGNKGFAILLCVNDIDSNIKIDTNVSFIEYVNNFINILFENNNQYYYHKNNIAKYIQNENNSQDNQYTNNNYFENIDVCEINIPYYNFLNFGLSRSKKQKLANIGYSTVKDYFRSIF